MINTATATSPYKGLMPYAEEDAPFFFGREAEREIITANLMASRLTLLYGASGVGKSSVLRAGVIYKLRQLGRQNMDESGKPGFVVLIFRDWRDDPVASLSKLIRECVESACNTKGCDLIPPSLGLTDMLMEWTRRIDGDLLIILDQFEEYFLYHEGESGKGTFASEFPRAVNHPSLRASFLISIREDALAKLDKFKGPIPHLFDNILRIEHLDRAAARKAIEGPVEQYNKIHATNGDRVRLGEGLLEAVLAQVKTGQVVLGDTGRGGLETGVGQAQIETPFLQMVMTRLWNEEMRSGSRELRTATLERLGGAEQIVRTHLDEKISALKPDERKIAAEVFHYLVTPSGTKIAYKVKDLTASEYVNVSEDDLILLLEKLSGSEMRILRAIRPSEADDKDVQYEIYHDVLAAAILDWRSRYHHEQKAIEALQEVEEQRAKAEQEAKSAYRLRIAVGLLGIFLILAVAATFYAYKQKVAADTKKAEADDNRVIALEARDLAEREKGRAEAQAIIAERKTLEATAARQDTEVALEEARKQRRLATVQARLALARARDANIAREAALAAKTTDTLYREATTLSLNGDQEAALDKFKQALPFYRLSHNREAEAATLSNIGLTYSQMGDDQQAIDYYETAIPIYGGLGDKRGQATMLKNIADIYHFEDEKGKDSDDESKAKKNKAIEYYKRAVPLYENDSKTLGTVFRNIADDYRLLDDKKEALNYYTRALPLLRSQATDLDEKSGEEEVLETIGTLLDELGNKEDAIKYYGQLGSKLKANNDFSGQARIEQKIGNIFKSMGNQTEALKHYQMAEAILQLRIATRSIRPKFPPSLFIDIGEIYEAQGDKQKALLYYERAAEILGNTTTYERIGKLHYELSNKQQAITYYDRAAKLFNTSRKYIEEARLLNSIGQIYQELGQTEKAQGYFNRAKQAEKRLAPAANKY